MERKRINSSRIRSAGYDPKTQTLEVEFSDGRIMSYRGVSPEIHRQFTNAPSPVSFFEDKIAESYPESRVR
jgi:KTSC domain-containing protein